MGRSWALRLLEQLLSPWERREYIAIATGDPQIQSKGFLEWIIVTAVDTRINDSQVKEIAGEWSPGKGSSQQMRWSRK